MSDLVHYEAQLPDLAGLRDPLLIAGFGGSWGTSAAEALRELVEHWEAQPLAFVDPQPFFDFTVRRPHVRMVEDEDADPGTRAIDWPTNEFYLARPEGAARDLVLLVGSEPQLRWRQFIDAVIAAMERFGVSESLMLGAYRAATPHSRPLPVQLYSRDAALGMQFGLVPQTWSYEGPAGITTPLAVACEERGWSSSSLLAAAPFYVAVEAPPLRRPRADQGDRATGSAPRSTARSTTSRSPSSTTRPRTRAAARTSSAASSTPSSRTTTTCTRRSTRSTRARRPPSPSSSRTWSRSCASCETPGTANTRRARPPPAPRSGHFWNLRLAPTVCVGPGTDSRAAQADPRLPRRSTDRSEARDRASTASARGTSSPA